MRLLLSLPLLLAGCPQPACTDIAMASVTVTVVDGQGDIVERNDLEVVWIQEGVETDCEAFSGTWTCGYEVQGSITVVARLGGVDFDEATVDVAHDGCHVVGEQVTLEVIDELGPGR